MIKLPDRIRRFILRQDSDSARDSRHIGWIKRVADGDLDALSALYDETSAVIFSFVLETLHEREAAEDALIEIYECARREATAFNPRQSVPIDWLISLARNVAVTRRRRMTSNPAPDHFKHNRQAAHLAVARLSDEQRTILEMTYIAGFTAGETAVMLELPLDYVKKQIVSGMQQLRAASQNADRVTIRLSTLRSV